VETGKLHAASGDKLCIEIGVPKLFIDKYTDDGFIVRRNERPQALSFIDHHGLAVMQ